MQKLGVFWKIQNICFNANVGTEIFQIEEEMTEKMMPKFGNHSFKIR